MTLVSVPEELPQLAQFHFHKRWNNEMDTLSVSQLQYNILHLQAELNKNVLPSNKTLLRTHNITQNPTRHYHGYMKQSRHLCYKIVN